MLIDKKTYNSSATKIICVFIQIVMYIAISLLNVDISTFGIICALYVIAIIVMNSVLQREVFTLSNIAIFIYSFLYLTYFILVCCGINPSMYDGYDLMKFFTTEVILNVGMFCLKSILIINISLSIFIKTQECNKEFVYNVSNSDRVKKVSNFIWLCLLPFILYNDINKIILTIKMGRNYVLMNGSFIERFESIFFITALIFLIAIRQNKKNKYLMAFLILRIVIIMFLTGNRIKEVIEICLLLYTYKKYIPHKKTSLPKKILIVLLIVLAIPILTYVGETRGKFSVSLFEYLRQSNVYLQFISNICTASFITPCYAMSYANNVGFLYGKSYLASLAVILPLSNTFFPGLVPFRQIGQMMNMYSDIHHTQGGSLFAEMYINFGYYSYILSFALGAIMAYIQNKINGSGKFEHSLFKSTIAIFIFYSLIIISRANFYDLVVGVKQIFYFLIVWYIVNAFLLKIIKHQK